MKLASVVAAAVAALAIVACAAPADEDVVEENVDSTQQKLCPVGAICGFDPPVFEQEPTAFQCPTKRVACNPFLYCTTQTYTTWYGVTKTKQTCSCEKGCTGSLFQIYSYNPCPSWAPTYTCTTYGYCTCQ